MPTSLAHCFSDQKKNLLTSEFDKNHLLNSKMSDRSVSLSESEVSQVGMEDAKRDLLISQEVTEGGRNLFAKLEGTFGDMNPGRQFGDKEKSTDLKDEKEDTGEIQPEIFKKKTNEGKSEQQKENDEKFDQISNIQRSIEQKEKSKSKSKSKIETPNIETNSQTPNKNSERILKLPKDKSRHKSEVIIDIDLGALLSKKKSLEGEFLSVKEGEVGHRQIGKDGVARRKRNHLSASVSGLKASRVRLNGDLDGVDLQTLCLDSSDIKT